MERTQPSSTETTRGLPKAEVDRMLARSKAEAEADKTAVAHDDGRAAAARVRDTARAYATLCLIVVTACRVGGVIEYRLSSLGWDAGHHVIDLPVKGPAGETQRLAVPPYASAALDRYIALRGDDEGALVPYGHRQATSCPGPAQTSLASGPTATRPSACTPVPARTGPRRSEVIQRGDAWRMHMVQTSDGLAGWRLPVRAARAGGGWLQRHPGPVEPVPVPPRRCWERDGLHNVPRHVVVRERRGHGDVHSQPHHGGGLAFRGVQRDDRVHAACGDHRGQPEPGPAGAARGLARYDRFHLAIRRDLDATLLYVRTWRQHGVA